MKQLRFFDFNERYEAVSQQGDPLEVIDNTIQCSTFNPIFKQKIFKQIQKKNRKSNAGRKLYNPTRMFKILVLQSGYNLSDEETEYPIKDRGSFMRFVGLSFEDRMPDATTIWLFREASSKHHVIKRLCARFNRYLDG